MTFNWNCCSIQSKQTIRWSFGWVDQHIRIDYLLLCWLEEDHQIFMMFSDQFLQGTSCQYKHTNTYWEFGATLHQVGPDGELSLSWPKCSACILLPSSWTRAQVKMWALHLQPRVKHVSLHHHLHGVRVACDHHRPRPRPHTQLRALRSGLDVAASPGCVGYVTCCRAGDTGDSVVHKSAFCECINRHQDDNPAVRGSAMVSVHARAFRFGRRDGFLQTLKTPPHV